MCITRHLTTTVSRLNMSSTLSLDFIPKINPHYRLQWEEAQNGYVLLYPEGMIKFNASAGIILSQCDGLGSVRDIIQKLTQQFPEATGLAQDVQDFFIDALQKKWVIEAPQPLT
jgi:pyrroloquinoline quinone biosynthesis protein D